ncbi:unnamed protein product, partial [Effrenium voratum]
VLARNGFPEVSEAEYREATRFTTPARLAFHAKTDPDHSIGLELAKQFDEEYVALVSPSSVPLFPGLQTLLQELVAKEVCLGALSNACGAYVRAVLAAHSLSSHFKCQLGADDVDEAKPNPGGLLRCCRLLGADPSECVYVGDSLGDGLAASAAGLRSVGVRWGDGKGLEAAFDEVVSTAEELRATLMRD